MYFDVLHTEMKRNRYRSELVFEISAFKIVKYIDVNVKCDFKTPFLLIFLIYLKKSTVGFFEKLICIREIPELHKDIEKVLSYLIRFRAIGVRREVVVAEFSTFYARRRFCAKVSDTV